MSTRKFGGRDSIFEIKPENTNEESPFVANFGATLISDYESNDISPIEHNQNLRDASITNSYVSSPKRCIETHSGIIKLR